MTESEKKVRVRFAPSPTGYMHVGNFRTALYNYLFAKKTSGDFLIRIEDTDQTRFVNGAAEQLLQSMNEMGIIWSEGNYLKSQVKDSESQKLVESKTYPNTVEIGEFGPYAQSERTEIYKKYAQQLVNDGHAYYCFCEPARLNEMRENQQKEKRAPMYDRYCLANLSPDQINQKLKEKCPATIRLKVPKDEIVEFDDMIRGKVSFNTSNIDDQVLLKSDGFPTYHLANVVDDHLMQITHVIRGEDWLPSTPKHILLYRAFGWEIPVFAHLPLLLNPDRSKLSKRQGDVAVEDYLAKGYLKEAILNFVAMLGWNPGEGSVQEIFSMEELIEKFELEKVHKAGAVFDIKKLDWINGQYIKKLSADDLLENALPFFTEKDFFAKASDEKKTDDYLKRVLTVEKERLAKFTDVGEENKFFFQDISYEKEMLHWKTNTSEETIASLNTAQTVLDEIPENDWMLAKIEEKLLAVAGDKRGDLLWPLRMALTGAQKSPSPFECAWVLGKIETLKRIAEAIKKL
ncbi:MAG: Glutamate-tRNA ligase [Candidatus Moranbacteria bacterium GW2011_GWC2_37_73]|nr:MAG: glutamyl-tRNA synthetase, glutamyl-tRNA synthetase [Parcubacteria group bacterium GW2011_GWC1_36_108]KKQ01245.1 MAG: Glutamate-tRNA ligase [Candidatus Moranbacteria bacterium GW2011_GWD1_36_198]KKQ02304.1 MAG: Glutamate-tRNA ligase [Candidatus Moranbacteria bacterium GW2011_GWD2_36_198]KKQ40199.1 MAG: Glutamate-tRNA ligase [Candidatus Moranbacteria bacterium GW2011_GWC2_37_73]HAR99701.1 glutamate--tRNA ligase [Candidatus Moranbacteria bacterium]